MPDGAHWVYGFIMIAIIISIFAVVWILLILISQGTTGTIRYISQRVYGINYKKVKTDDDNDKQEDQ